MSVEVVRLSNLKILRSKLKFALNLYADRHPVYVDGEPVIKLSDVKMLIDKTVTDKKVV